MPLAGFFLVPSIFLWSAVIHTGVILAILMLQHLASQVTNPRGAHYSTISEFLFSVGWVMMTLESGCICIMWSETGGLIVLGLRLFFTSLAFDKVYGNPCGALFDYLSRWPSKKLPTLLRPLCAQMLAIPFGISTSIFLWRVAAIFNDDYTVLLEKEVNYFLNTDPMPGFLVEALLSFLIFVPKIFMAPSIFSNVFETMYIVFLVGQFGVSTGANMNPLSAFATYLVWHSHYLGAWDLFVHVFVFFLGPLVGTVVAVGVQRSYRTVDKTKQF